MCILDTNSKNTIYGYLNEVLNRFKTHITNEISRLSDQLTSYNNNYETILNRFNNYKTTIYNQFYTMILSVNNEFYEQIVKKFYTNYIEKYLKEYLNHAKKESTNEFQFLNVTINIKEIEKEIIEKCVNEYKYLAMTHINYLHQKNNQQLDTLFSFATIQNTINNEINTIYNNQLLPILQQKATYTPGDAGVSNYDFSDTIINDINSFMKTKIEEVRQIVDKMKNSKYNIVEDWKVPDFSLVKRDEFSNVEKSFNKCCKIYHDKELNEINQIIFQHINNDFSRIIENFIPTFGKDFFDRILKYNEIQKIKSLFNNFKYSLKQTINYNTQLCSSNHSIIISEELKTQILSLNNLESIINKIKNSQISCVNKKLDMVFGDTRDSFVDKFIYNIKSDFTLKLAFEENVLSVINKILDENSNIFEDEYFNVINNNIKNTFIAQYTNIINEQTNSLLQFIQENKNIIKNKLDNLNSFKSNIILSDINNKANKLINVIDEYYIYNKNFEISDEVQLLLNNYCKNKIVPYYNEFKSILDISTKNITIQNMENNIQKIKNKYIFNDFDTKSNVIRNNFKNSYFNNITDYLEHSYGSINSAYLINLEKEIAYLDA